MIVKALQSWNHHAPEATRHLVPGDLINIDESVAKYMIKEGWAVKA